MDYSYEQNLINQGYKLVCGIDEAGRGPLAGPLVAGAVILDVARGGWWDKIKDSKAIDSEKRAEAFELITQNSLCWSLGVVSSEEIDKHGLAFANKIAMKRAWSHLRVKPDYILSDYMAKVHFNTRFELIIKGDSKILSVAAASIIAKVLRDRMMDAFARKYPEYGFDQHRGYGTKFHLDKLREFGPCPIHRKTFEPVRVKLF